MKKYKLKTILKEIKVSDLIIEFKKTKYNFNKQDREPVFYDSNSFAIRSKSYEITIYDKYKDFLNQKRSKTRSYSKNDDYSFQTSFFDQINNKEIARIELRLNNSRQIKSKLQSFGEEIDLDFQTIFSKDLSQKLLFNEAKIISNNLPLIILDTNINDFELFTLIRKYNCSLSDLKVLEVITFRKLFSDNSYRDVRSLFDNDKNFLRIYKTSKELILPENFAQKHIDQIIKGIMKFEPTKMSDYI